MQAPLHEELARIHHTLCQLYREGRLGISSLWHGFFTKRSKTDSLWDCYHALCTDPKCGARACYGSISRKFLVEHAKEYIKYCLKGAPRELAKNHPYSPFWDTFISEYENADWTKPKTTHDFLCVSTELLRGSYFFPNADKRQAYLSLLTRIESTQILSSPIPKVFRYYFLSLLIESKGESLAILPSQIQCTVYRVRIYRGVFQLHAVLYAPELRCCVLPRLWACCDATREEIPIFLSSQSYVDSYERTGSAYGFLFSHEPNFSSLSLCVKLGDISLPIVYTFAKTSAIAPKHSRIHVQSHGYELAFLENCFTVKRCDTTVLSRSPLWLYSDYHSVGMDNAFWQFVADCKHDDGVDRYYILHKDRTSYGTELDPYESHLVPFGSKRHRELFLQADKILASFVDAPRSYNPFSLEEFSFVAHQFQAELCYLQHGILHAHIPWRYSPISEDFFVDSIVISSRFELHNFQDTYHFQANQLLPVGMARYQGQEPRPRTRTILYAPSWRAYVDDIADTPFARGLVDLLTNQKLHQFLEDHSLDLAIQLHPLYQSYAALWPTTCNRIRFVRKYKENPCILCTDFSSYVFDFARERIPISYYFPDIQQFQEGHYQYRALDYPLCFGELAVNVEDLLQAWNTIVANGFVMESHYQQYCDEFFF